MANKNSGPSVDYYELRRRHQQYKESVSDKRAEEKIEAPAENEDIPAKEVFAPAEDIAEPAEESDIFQKFQEAEDDMDEEEPEEESDGSNPFQSIFTAFGKVKSVISKKRRKSDDEEILDDSDENYEDEEPQEEKKGPFRFFRKKEEDDEDIEPEDEPIDEPADEPDIEPIDEPIGDTDSFKDEAPAEKSRFQYSEDDEYEDDDEDENDEREMGGLKKFASLFIVREGREEYDDDEVTVEDDFPVIKDSVRKTDEIDDSMFVGSHDRRRGKEEHMAMDEGKNTRDLTEIMAEGVDEKILSRRERRELRERQNSIQNVESGDDEMPAPDEPTREYKIVSRPTPVKEKEAEPLLFDDVKKPNAAIEDVMLKAGITDAPKAVKFDDYDDGEEEDVKPLSRKSAAKFEDDYDDDDDDEDEKPRGRKKAAKYEDDYDDDDDEDVKPARRKSKKSDDDYDDGDYDEDYDDEYEGDDDSPSFGHYVLGFFKILIAIVLILVVAVFGLYFADQAIDGGVGAYRWITDKVPVIENLLPASVQATPAPESLDGSEVTPAPDATDEPVNEPTAEPSATDALNLGDLNTTTEEPVTTAAPDSVG